MIRTKGERKKLSRSDGSEGKILLTESFPLPSNEIECIGCTLYVCVIQLEYETQLKHHQYSHNMKSESSIKNNLNEIRIPYNIHMCKKELLFYFSYVHIEWIVSFFHLSLNTNDVDLHNINSSINLLRAVQFTIEIPACRKNIYFHCKLKMVLVWFYHVCNFNPFRNKLMLAIVCESFFFFLSLRFSREKKA